MLIQRNSATTYKVLHESTTFDDFIELVTHENFGKEIKWNRQHKDVQVPHSGTTYTLLEVYQAKAK
jgi:hypothetical protein